MSVDWGVLPVIPETHQWLQEEGYEVIGTESRYPTLDEILVVLRAFGDLPVTEDHFAENCWILTLGTPDSFQYACILGKVENDTLFHFHFTGSRCQHETMVRILKGLAVTCGPLVLYEQIAATPMIVDQHINIGDKLEEWKERIKRKYNQMGLTSKGLGQ